MKKMQIIISIALLSIVLSIPAYAGTKNGKKDEIYVRIPVNSDIFEPDEVFYLRVNKGDRVSLTKSTITYIDKKEMNCISALMVILQSGKVAILKLYLYHEKA